MLKDTLNHSQITGLLLQLCSLHTHWKYHSLLVLCYTSTTIECCENTRMISCFQIYRLSIMQFNMPIDTHMLLTTTPFCEYTSQPVKLVWVQLHQPPQLHDHQRHQDLKMKMKKKLSSYFQRAQHTHTVTTLLELEHLHVIQMIYKLIMKHGGEI